MNRSLFSASPFRPAYGLQPIRVLGQGEGLVEDFESLLQPLEDLIAQLPVEVAGPYKTRRDECLAKSILSRYKCLYDLFQDVKDRLQGGGGTTTVTPPKPVVQPPASSGIPVWAIAAGGVVAAGLLYVAFGK